MSIESDRIEEERIEEELAKIDAEEMEMESGEHFWWTVLGPTVVICIFFISMALLALSGAMGERYFGTGAGVLIEVGFGVFILLPLAMLTVAMNWVGVD